MKSKYGAIHDAAMDIADPLVRNRGTAAGTSATPILQTILPAVMLALDAVMAAIAPGGSKRSFRAQEFFVDTFTTALSHDEILTEIAVPAFTRGVADPT